jgi:hypothetical protein
MKMNSKSDSNTPFPFPLTVAEVRYSLPEMLRELQVERTAASFAMEKLDQREIEKLFKSELLRRGYLAQ